MKKIHSVFFTILIIFATMLFMACNAAKEQVDSLDFPVAEISKKPSVEEFKKMSPAEQWKVISPVRRNMWREMYLNNEPIPDEMRPIIANDLDYERGDPNVKIPRKTKGTNKRSSQNDLPYQVEMTVDQWNAMSLKEKWDTFSDERKEYMRQHPESYTEYKAFF